MPGDGPLGLDELRRKHSSFKPADAFRQMLKSRENSRFLADLVSSADTAGPFIGPSNPRRVRDDWAAKNASQQLMDQDKFPVETSFLADELHSILFPVGPRAESRKLRKGPPSERRPVDKVMDGTAGLLTGLSVSHIDHIPTLLKTLGAIEALQIWRASGAGR